VTPTSHAVYTISVAAELAGVHPQTLRTYERKGLIAPARTSGGTRRYSERDVVRVRLIQDLTQGEGVNLAGVLRILALQDALDSAQDLLVVAQRTMVELRRDAAEALDEQRRRNSAALVPYRATQIERHPGTRGR